MKDEILKGDVYYVRLRNSMSTYATRGGRPCLVVQNNIGNHKLCTTMIVPLTTNTGNKPNPVQPIVTSAISATGYQKKSLVKCDNIMVVDKDVLEDRMFHLSDEDILKVDKALSVTLGLGVVDNKPEGV